MSKDDGLRIEFYEKISEMSDEERTYYVDELGMRPPKSKTTYRRIYPKLCSIDMPKELPDITTDCLIAFKDNTFIVVRGSYDDICMKLDEREKLLDQEYEYEEGEE